MVIKRALALVKHPYPGPCGTGTRRLRPALPQSPSFHEAPKPSLLQPDHAAEIPSPNLPVFSMNLGVGVASSMPRTEGVVATRCRLPNFRV